MRRVIAGLVVAGLWVSVGDGAERAPTAGIAVVVGSGSTVHDITKDTLRDVYLRQQRVWPDGRGIVPINLPATHPIREAFSRAVLGRSTQDLVSYWSGRFFDGITPPQVLPSPTAVRRFIAAEPGAIAYLPMSEVDESCRVLIVLDSLPRSSATRE